MFCATGLYQSDHAVCGHCGGGFLRSELGRVSTVSRGREGLITQSDKAGRKETEDGWRKGGGEGGDDAWIGYSTLARARRATRAGRAGITLFRRIERVSEPSSSSCSCEQPFDGWTNAMRTRINEASKRRFLRSLLPVCARKRQRAICDRYCPH